MDVTPLIKKGQQIIQSYTDGAFKISGAVYHSGVIVTPDMTVEWKTGHLSPESLYPSDFEQFLQFQGRLDVLIIGTGGQHVFLPPAVLKPLKMLKINAEFMDTGAACRTYNVLMAEGRRVAAALLPVLKA